MVVIFILKTPSIFNNTETYQKIGGGNGLTYGNATIEDLVNKDTDGDGIPDWQESLYGLDPTKKETTPGIPDSVALEKLKTAQAKANSAEKTSGDSSTPENLTQTDKFSRELFTTIAALNQNGAMDQATIDALGASLTEKMQNLTVRKVFTLSDIKIISKDDAQTIQKYKNALTSIYAKYPIKKGFLTVLQEFITDEKNVATLSQIDPIVNQLNKIIAELIKIDTPQSMSDLHLNLINGFERVTENINDVKLIDSDTIFALNAIIKYKKNILLLKSAVDDIKKK